MAQDAVTPRRGSNEGLSARQGEAIAPAIIFPFIFILNVSCIKVCPARASISTAQGQATDLPSMAPTDFLQAPLNSKIIRRVV